MNNNPSVRQVFLRSLFETVLFILGYITGFVIRDVVIGVRNALNAVVKEDEAAPYGKAILQIFINAFLITYLSTILKTSTLMFSIGLFAAQSKLIGVAIFEKVDKKISGLEVQ